jgi:hypothetical protein
LDLNIGPIQNPEKGNWRMGGVCLQNGRFFLQTDSGHRILSGDKKSYLRTKLKAMQTITLQVQDHAYPKLLEFLKQFDEGEIRLSHASNRQSRLKAEMEEELARIENGTAELMDWDEFSAELDEMINEYESNNHS